jgi:predicted phosphohydrolase
MTKVRILSDAHLETYKSFEDVVSKIKKTIPDNERSEVLILPGDLGFVTNEELEFNKDYENLLKYLKTRWDIVIVVPGNTEYQGIRSFNSIIETDKILRKKCKELGVIYLQKGVVKIDKFFFVGCTLWSFITKKEWNEIKDADKDIFMDMEVYRRMYIEDLEWLHSILHVIKHIGEQAVVITHYPPVTKANNPSFKLDGVKVNHIDMFMNLHQSAIKMWICGHIHDKSQLEGSKVPVYINSIGESDETHSHFKSGLIKI